MNRRSISPVMAIVAMAMVVSAHAGQDLPVKFHRLMLADGLSQSSILSLHQDHQGFIWMGTQDGLNRYDGRGFISFKSDPDDPHSLSDPNIWCIMEDADGDLWLGTEGGGFNRFNRNLESFTPYRFDPRRLGTNRHYDVKAMVLGPDGTIWIGTVGDGLLQFDPVTEAVRALVHDQENPASLASNNVHSLLLDGNGGLYVGTEAGLSHLDLDTGLFRNHYHHPENDRTLPAGQVRSLTHAKEGGLWVGTTSGLCMLDPESGRVWRYAIESDAPDVPTDPSISTVLQHQDGKLWIGTERFGAHLLDPIKKSCRSFLHDPQDPFSLSDNEVYSILMDRAGVIWIGTSNGANRLDTRAKQFFHMSNKPGDPASLSNDCVWSLWEDRSGNVWTATEAGLNVLDSKTGEVRQIFADPDDPRRPSYNSFIEVFEDKEGNLWFGARDGALNRYHPRSGVFERIAADPGSSDGPDDDRIFTIAGDAQGKVWLGTMTGLECYDPQTDRFTAFYNDPEDPTSLPAGSVRDLHMDAQGRLWMSVWGNGVAYRDPETGHFHQFKNHPQDRTGLSSNVVLCIFQDSWGKMWIGTTTGLNLLDPETGKCRWYTERDGLPNNTIYRIQEDRSAQLWVSTNFGLARFNPFTGDVRTYLVKDGIQDNEFNMGASHLGRSGRMYFGGINGFTAFYPDSIQHNPYVPPVVLTDFRIFNKKVPVGENTEGRVILEQAISNASSIDLSYKDDVISFEFAVLHYASPEKNNFAYMLEGFESEWNEVGTRNHATYTNLPPGDFVFRVRGSNNDGVWNEEGLAVDIHVHPPFYRKAWFITSAVLLLWAFIYGMHRYRMRLLDVKNKVLERRVTERTEDLTLANRHLQQEISIRKQIEDELREARNNAVAATRAKSDFLANMSHEIRTPMNGVLGMTAILLDTELSSDQREYSEMIYSSANNLLVIINDILDFSKIEAGKLKIENIRFDMCDVVDRVTEMLAFKAHEKSLFFQCSIDPRVPRMLYGDPGRLTQILINLTNNAVKFTTEGCIRINIHYVQTLQDSVEVRFEVKDTGVGIPADRVEKIFESFTQVDASTTRKFGGTGLGLAIVKQLAGLMGGEIGVDSIEGEGASFWMNIKLDSRGQPDQEPEESLLINGVDRARPLPGKQILIVHRDEAVGQGLEAQLAYLGHEARAMDAETAFETLMNERTGRDLILVEALDDRSATSERVQKLKAACPQDTTPFVLLCKLGKMLDARELDSSGLSTYLNVPVLHGKLENLLEDLENGRNGRSVGSALKDAGAANSAAAKATGPLLLLAEDNPINQRVASLMLENLGYCVDVVASGLEAVEAASRKDYSAILMDVQMPEMDGLEATRRIRAADSTALNPDVPIIALTAHARDQDRKRSLAAGMDDHASKPIDSETIAKILSRVLEPSDVTS